MAYLVTGGTGFIGRYLLRELDRRGQPIHVLVRPRSVAKLQALGLQNARPLIGDITRSGLGVAAGEPHGLGHGEGVPLATVYDPAAAEEATPLANVDGTPPRGEIAKPIRAAPVPHM